jgi:biotin carboxyl carrier protein
MRSLTYRWQDEEYTVALQPTTNDAGLWHVQIPAQQSQDVACSIGNDGLLLIKHGATQTRAYVQPDRAAVQVVLHGQSYRLLRRQPPDVATSAHSGAAADAQKALTAPMAGTLVKVQVHPGQQVQEQQVLVILSAMKMEHAITAPYAGKVLHVHYQEGAVVPGGSVLVEME